MGKYLNPNGMNFKISTQANIFVDKSEIIELTNSRIYRGDSRFIYVSRPRRFGKTSVLDMLCAYYSKSSECGGLFDTLNIAESGTYQKYKGKYHVIYLDMQKILQKCDKDVSVITRIIDQKVIKELKDLFTDFDSAETDLPSYLEDLYSHRNIEFVFLVDEWDCVFRIIKSNDELKKQYLDYWSSLLKGQPYVALAYMTGILPIRQYGHQSVLNMFNEYTMLNSYEFAQFIGYTSEDVKKLCDQFDVSYEDMQMWYDGYTLDGVELYCPKSVNSAISNKRFGSYWTSTDSYESLVKYITMNFDGLKDAVSMLLSDQKIEINTRTFANDMFDFNSKDDVLTALIHLGYLSCTKTFNPVLTDTFNVSIPNKEIASEFVSSMQLTGNWKSLTKAILGSLQLIEDTLQQNAESVAKQIQEVHLSVGNKFYNNEQALASTIRIAYYGASAYYKMIEEMPSGRGYADVVLIPRNNVDSQKYLPMIIELKWDKTANAAIEQIKNKQYPHIFHEFEKILLVGINYDPDSDQHDCMIEEYKI